MELPYQYPPDLLQLLIDTIPLLCRSKQDVLTFLRGAGISPDLMADEAKRVQRDRHSITKFEIVRRVLTRLNEVGDSRLRERREVLKRVIEYEDFSTCWPDDTLKAKGLVGEIRRVINVKDSFTRINQERKAEQRHHQSTQLAAVEKRARAAREKDEIKAEFYRLFADPDEHRRGKALEAVLNRLFNAGDILVRDAFTLRISGAGVVEQIDGVIELDSHLYLVEVKWWRHPLGPGDVAQHLVRVFGRGDVRGLFVSYSGYTPAAVESCREALRDKVVALALLQEFVTLLERNELITDLLATFIRAKARAAQLDKNPLHEPLYVARP